MNTRTFAVAVLLLAAAPAARGVGPASFEHADEAEFTAGELNKIAVTSLGEVTLSRALQTLLPERDDLGMVSALAADAQGRVFLAAVPGPAIYRLEDGKPVKVAELPGVLIRGLLVQRDDLVAGVCGKDHAGLYRVDAKGGVKAMWKDPAVAAVWAVLPAGGDSFYVATGPEGKVFHVAADGKAVLLYDSEDDNVLCLAAGGKGLLYAGTGENGLVVEIDPAKRKGRVLLDAQEKEISCLVVDADGVVYAATSDASKAAAAAPRPSRPPAAGPGMTTGPGAPPPPAAVPATAPAAAPAGAATRPGGPDPATPTPAAAGPTRPAPAQTVRIPLPRPSGPSGVPSPTRPPEEEGPGNAVYRIDTEGFVRSVFRRPVTVLALTLAEGTLLLGTGHDGQVFAADRQGERAAMLVKLDPRDVTCLLPDGRGRLLAATADKAAVVALEKDFEPRGTLVSKVLDAKQVARWGTVSVRADVPAGCSGTIATRTGNVAEAKDTTWSDWSAEAAVREDWLAIASPPGRFLQYRLTLTGKGSEGPKVHQVRLVYQVGNLAPVIQAVQVVPSPGPQPAKNPAEAEQPLRYRLLQVKAADPNADAVQWSVHIRRAGREKWIQLVEKVTEPQYAWDTLATGDGTYEVMVQVSDAPANPPDSALTAKRVLPPLPVDNSAPLVEKLSAKVEKNQVRLSGAVSDATSRIRQMAYAVDGGSDWKTMLPGDGICDSQKETFAATLKDLSEGVHLIAVKAVDEFNNAGYASVEVTVGK